MNEKEIITAWKCCSNVITSSCKECPLHLTYNANCVRELMRVSLDLYNRKKAEIFNLKEEVKHFQLKNSELFKLNNSIVEENDYRKAENERLQKSLDNMTDALVKTDEACRKAKSEAYREFAERLCKDRVSNDPVVIAVKVELEELTEKNDFKHERRNHEQSKPNRTTNPRC